MQKELLHLIHILKFNDRLKQSRINNFLLKILENNVKIKPHEMILKTLYGFKLKINPALDKGVERSIFNTGTYEAGTLHAFDLLLKKGDIFIDIGSNIGLMAIYASQKVGTTGHIYSFEPEPKTYKILCENCDINNIKNITLNNIALGAKESKGIIYSNLDINRGAASLVRRDGTKGTEISISTLDNYLDSKNIRQVKLIKADIEGYEFEMLKGASKLLHSEYAPILCIEYSNDVQSVTEVSDVYDFVTSINKYQVYKFTEWKGSVCKLQKVQIKSDLPEHDNIFCFLPHHLRNINSSLFLN